MQKIFDNDFDSLVEADIYSLKERNYSEGLFAEYKLGWIDNKKITKSISSFANSHGGYLFIGIKANRSHNLPESFPGVPPKDGLKEKIKDICRSHIDPPPLFKTAIVDLSNGNVILVVKVEESDDPPHITKDGRIYIRTPESSDPIPENDRHAINRLYEKSSNAEKKYDVLTSLIIKRIKDLFPQRLSFGHLIVCPFPIPSVMFADIFSSLKYHQEYLKIIHESGWLADYVEVMQDGILSKSGWRIHINGLFSNTKKFGKIGEKEISEDALITFLYRGLTLIGDFYAHVDYSARLRILLLLYTTAGKEYLLNGRTRHSEDNGSFSNQCEEIKLYRECIAADENGYKSIINDLGIELRRAAGKLNFDINYFPEGA